jgi:large subunit ribosomal protein L19
MNKVLSPVKVETRQKLDFRSGDTVRVHQKIQEKGKTRLQVFEGLVLARKHGAEAGATFTVRRMASGVGVEKVFPLFSPMIDKIEVVKRAKVRQSKLYHIREKAAKEIRRQMRNLRQVKDTEEEEIPEEEAKVEEAEVASENLETPETKEEVKEEASTEEKKEE